MSERDRLLEAVRAVHEDTVPQLRRLIAAATADTSEDSREVTASRAVYADGLREQLAELARHNDDATARLVSVGAALLAEVEALEAARLQNSARQAVYGRVVDWFRDATEHLRTKRGAP